MREFLTPFETTADSVGVVVLRLLAALLLGAAVAQIYRRARSEPASSFTATLVLLSVLIAMVTQVIGDNVARAFSLVGALSIVRFRTVVRDTQDTAYVIFAVAVGMAVGASTLWVAVAGMAVVAIGAFAMKRESVILVAPLPFRLHVRVGLGHDANALLAPVLDGYGVARRLSEVKTTRQGTSTDVVYRVALRDDDSGHPLVTALNRLDGVQGVTIERVGTGEDEPV